MIKKILKPSSQILMSSGLIKLRGPKILAYHSVNDKPKYKIDVSNNHFIEHVNYLKDNYNIISINELVTRTQFSENDVVLTFDDGFEDYFTFIFPLLQSYNIPSTNYVISSTLEGEKGFNFPSAEGKSPMTYKMVEELSKEEYCTIGNHTHSHVNLNNSFTDEELHVELVESKKIIESITGYDVKHFCYPWAKYNKRNALKVNEVFETAVIGKGHIIGDLDYQKLCRIPIFNESLDAFKSRLNGSGFLENRLRHYYNLI